MSLQPNKTLRVGPMTIHVGDLDEKPHLGYVLSTCKIETGLPREVCPFCSTPDCCYHCDGSTASHRPIPTKVDADDSSPEDRRFPDLPLETEDEVAARLKYNGGMSGIEDLAFACAVAGMDVESNAFDEAMETAVNSIEEARRP